MTSEAETLKTNEFLRRRKLRLQQVREQSKDIAKRIRQRAKVETLRHVVDLDAKKQKEYFDKQEKLVKRLEVLYARGINNIGASHQSASELRQDGIVKTDLSKSRGKEAAAELRKNRQQKLDQQKKLLDRKVQARENANIISREKSSAALKKITKVIPKHSEEASIKATEAADVNTCTPVVNQDGSEGVTKNDMATQCNSETVPNDWQPAVPALVLPNDDQVSLNLDEQQSKSDKSKRLDLFAVSEEMPTDLFTRHVHVSGKGDTQRPSLTLVSEYLETRKLRLRENEPIRKNKRADDIPSLKETIIRTRTTKAAGKGSDRVDNLTADHVLNKKSSVTMYNHNTRDSRDLPYSDEQLVVRDSQTEEDAYAQALRESHTNDKDQETQKKVKDIRSRVAMTKQNVEREYKDTINFLNSLPKDNGNKVTKTAYMDERRQQIHNENRQHKLQQEYRKIEKECRRHHSCAKKSHNKSRSISKQDIDDDFDVRDFQYSWMPVPEGDGNLAIHTIPNTVKEGKSGNTVKFSKVDSYHEYRSRHKHTPPTKDTSSHDKDTHRNRPQSVIIDKDESQSTDSSSASDTSSVENLRLEKKEKKNRQDAKVDQNASDAERIIIYKILDTKSEKQSKKKNKLLSDIAKSLTSIEKVQKSAIADNISEPVKKQHVEENTDENPVSFGHINEGIYKVTEKNKDNLNSVNSLIDHIEKPPATEHNEQCQCRKLSSDKKRRTIPEWESDHVLQPQRTPKCSHCSTSCRENDYTTEFDAQNIASTSKLPSSSSSSSFKTAKNDKSKSTSLDCGYIKLVDEIGQESGKFFLKNNAYEVVIQLRKKDTSKDEEKSQESTEKNKESSAENKSYQNIPTRIQEPIQLVISESDNNLRQNLESDSNFFNKNLSGQDSVRISPQSARKVDITEVENRTADKMNYNPTVPNGIEDMDKKRSEQKKNVSDKATLTNIQNEYHTITPSLDPPSRPATTTCTQTTGSPLHRPVYIHMSSSTSTAYMSPPDMILPNLMRHDSGLNEYERGEFKNRNYTHKPVHSSRSLKKCRHARKSLGKVGLQPMENRINKLHSTPPNSLRSSPISPNSLHKVDSKVKKCRCRKCAVSASDPVKRINTKNEAFDSLQSSQNYNLSGTKGTVKYKYPTSCSACSRKTRDATLNPTVKGYINKLLALNKEGLKALEVADQECSSVGTPGSSIINVSYNIDDRKASIQNKISLEYIKNAFMRQIMNEHLNKHLKDPVIPPILLTASKKALLRKPRKKPVHKVKSLNISKNLLKCHKHHVSVSTTTDDCSKTFASSNVSRPRPRGSLASGEGQSPRTLSALKQYISAAKPLSQKTMHVDSQIKNKAYQKDLRKNYMSKRAVITDTSQETESTKDSNDYYRKKPDIPISMSTQTSQNNDSDFLKLAEDKLQNMEKIADLTEKCTKRLSNLAKVLEEVRKNKSLVYSQISTSDSTDSHTDQKSDKVAKTPVPGELDYEPNTLDTTDPVPEKEYTPVDNKATPPQFISFLTNIPKPAVYKLPEQTASNSVPSNISNVVRPIPVSSPITTDTNSNEIIKCKQKPPPALSRIHLKHGQEDIVPHELSTVIEVDSPMSVKNKTHSSRRYDPNTTSKSSSGDRESTKTNKNSESSKSKDSVANPDLLQSNLKLPLLPKLISTESSNNSKFQMIDLKQFNEIMLEPFISIHEYAKKYNAEAPEEMSNVEELPRDEISSLHSDGSLPDVIAELLKRNIITEPFKFDTASNVNSTTVSSESTLSMLALSKARKAKKKSNVVFRNKENIGETSDTLSISSNPDLENAFKKLGMGWASSTLKKTKERLALSSSSNTSSSSMSQLKIKTLHQDIPALVTDSVSSVLLSKKGNDLKNVADNSKDAKHQTSFPNSMTVNEFLANELANKITFTSNKSSINETEEEFVSLFETKMPEGMNQQTRENCDENSNDSARSGVNRARTSTPVQIFKSMTYHSSSGSNISNGLFSNADDLSSVKMTSNSIKNHSTSDRDELTIPNFSLKMKKGSDSSKSD